MRIVAASAMRGFGLVLLWLCLALAPGWAQADLMLYPTRVVFDKNTRTAQVELINTGTEAATYRITVVNRRMTETGEFISIEAPAPGEQFSGEFLRYSPRQVELPAGGTQTVRLLLRKPADLPAGEYRSHLQFDLVPEAAGATSIDRRAPTLGAGEVGVQLRAVLAVSIPVIVRQGNTSSEVRLSGLKLESPGPDAPALTAVIERSGNQSVYGDLVATLTDAGGTEREVGRAAGVAVYTPNPIRRIRMALQPSAAPLLRAGTLRLSFVQRPDEGGKALAQSELKLP